MPFESPNYSQIPNELLGNPGEPSLMASMHEAELKVVLAVCRLTFGWHRYQARAALSILMEMTGLSKQGVLNGAALAEEHNLIRRVSEPGRGKLSVWEVILGDSFNKKVNGVDQLEGEKGQRSRPISEEKVNAVDNKGQRSRHMKESNKETGDDPDLNNIFLSSNEAKVLWGQCLELLKTQRPAREFEGTRGLARENGTLRVACNSPQRKWWLEERIPNLVEDALATVAPGVKVVFEVAS